MNTIGYGMTYLSLLIIAAHPDDETLWAGGTMALHAQKYSVNVLCLTGLPPRSAELQKACDILGASSAKALPNPDFSVGAHLRTAVIEEILRTKPEVVITHAPKDYHPDHRAAYHLVVDAIEWAAHATQHHEAAWMVERLLLMEAHNLHTFPTLFVDVSSVMSQKRDAIKVFTTQHQKLPDYYQEFVFTKSRLRGIQAGVEYAEAFLEKPLARNGRFYPQSQSILDLIQPEKENKK